MTHTSQAGVLRRTVTRGQTVAESSNSISMEHSFE